MDLKYWGEFEVPSGLSLVIPATCLVFMLAPSYGEVRNYSSSAISVRFLV